MYALTLYGISDTQGTAFSLVMWSMQAAWLVVLGLFSAAYVVWDDRHNAAPPKLLTVEQDNSSGDWNGDVHVAN